MDLTLIVWVAISFYFIFILLRYWKGILVFELAAIIPLIVLLTQFGSDSIEMSVLFGALILVHIGGFVMNLNKG